MLLLKLIACENALKIALSDIKSIHKDETWHKIIVHEILYKTFNEDMQKLQTEIEIYNSIKLIQTSNWINKNR